MSAKWITKNVHRIPRLLNAALAGDMTALAILIAMGLGALYYSLKNQ